MEMAGDLQRHIAIEGGKVQGPCRRQAHELGRVQNESDVVEGRRDEASGRDATLPILISESICERKPGKEGTNRWYQQLELGLPMESDLLVRN